MKKLIIYSCLLVLVIISCHRKKYYLEENIHYRIRVDGSKNKEIKLNYIGNSKYKKVFYESNLKIPSINNVPAYFGNEGFKMDNNFNKNDPIYEIENSTNDVLYVLVLFRYGDEEKNKPQIYDPYFPQYYTEALIEVYTKEDEDSNYVADKYLKTHKGDVKYIPRIEFYETLIEHKFPYIYKLKPKEKCIVLWGLVK